MRAVQYILWSQWLQWPLHSNRALTSAGSLKVHFDAKRVPSFVAASCLTESQQA